MPSIEDWNTRGQGMLPGTLGVVITSVSDRQVEADMTVRRDLDVLATRS